MIGSIVDFSGQILFDQLTSLAKVLDLGLDCGPKSPPKPRHGLMELGPSSLIMKKFF